MEKWVWTQKEKQMIAHYRRILMEHTFDEYDILGMLILIRQYCRDSGLDSILEFSDLIAHRNRDKGRVQESIYGAIKNQYDTEKDSNGLIGYNGIKWKEWSDQWTKLGEELEIALSDQLLQEITLCIFSLAQDTTYDSNHKKKEEEFHGRIWLFQASNGQISLCTTDGSPHSLYVRFMVAEGVKGENRKFDGVIDCPVETFRKDGKLHLKTSNGELLI